MTMQELTTFPEDVYYDTYCGARRSLYKSHGVYSESRSQRNLLYVKARSLGYEPPRQTCCHHQVTALLKALETVTATHG